MSTYTIVTPDDQEDCITRAREAHNKDLPAEVDDGNGTMVPNPDLIADNAGYVQWVMENAVLSYCHQYFPRWPDRIELPPQN